MSRNPSPRRLMLAMQQQAILSMSEAQSAINALRRGDAYGGSEAVLHYGGAAKLVRDAFKNRHLVKRFTPPDAVDRQFTPSGYCLEFGHDCSGHPMPDMRNLLGEDSIAGEIERGLRWPSTRR